MPSLDSNLEDRALAIKAQHPGWGYRRIADEIGAGRRKVRRWLGYADGAAAPGTQARLPIISANADLPALVEIARRALAQAKTVDEVKGVHDKAEALRVYGRLAKDHGLEADAAEVRLKAERKLGLMLVMEKEGGTLGPGRNRPKVNGADGEQLKRVTLEEIDIDRKLSSRAQKVAAVPKHLFDQAVARVVEQIKDGTRTSLDIAGQTKAERRALREKVLGGIQCALPTQKFGVVVADPEWRFEPWSRETGMDRSADNHYPTSVTEVIAARDVASIAADDCVLFLWATVPMLPQALLVMGAWGFDYKSHIIWSKRRDYNHAGLAATKPAIGTGYWFRNCHELLLVGARGKIPAPAMGDQWLSLIEAIIGKHSEKPECFLEMIEQYFPTLPKIELNREGAARPGWAAWGFGVKENAA
jgi:N6-adenosine-specific RNA methylase IME4